MFSDNEEEVGPIVVRTKRLTKAPDDEEADASYATSSPTSSQSSAPKIGEVPELQDNTDSEGEMEDEVKVVDSEPVKAQEPVVQHQEQEEEVEEEQHKSSADSSDTEEEPSKEEDEEEEDSSEAGPAEQEQASPVQPQEEDVEQDEDEADDLKAPDVSDGCVTSKAVASSQEKQVEEEEDEDDSEAEAEEPIVQKEAAIEAEAEEDLEEEDEEEIVEERREEVANSPSPPVSSHHEPEPEARNSSPERKSSHGSSSYDDDEEDVHRRASSQSPEPPKAIEKPQNASQQPNNKDITKIYTGALVNTTKESLTPPMEKVVRSKPATDITQIYTASLQRETPESPRLERARGGKPVKDITQLYTANLNKPERGPAEPSPQRPMRNENITRLYTGSLNKENGNDVNYRLKPKDEITTPKKHNMSTSVDREAIRQAYLDVQADGNEIDWATFVFDESNRLTVGGTGNDFSQFKSFFTQENRGFGYIKIQTGDEMSKRSRFVFVTWVGASVSVMKKAKMSTDRTLVKEIVQNLSVELQLENQHELSLEHLKTEVDKAGGARYGTGVRDK